VNTALQNDITRLGRAAQSLLSLGHVGSTSTIQKQPPVANDVAIETNTAGVPRVIVQVATRPRRRVWFPAVLESA